jgi:DNA-binding transcriptional ArsR family regulator
MPAPESEFIRSTTPSTIRVALEPAANMLHSLFTLSKSEHLSGYDAWITETAARLTPGEMHRNLLVTIGLHYAIIPGQSWSSFPAYLDNLAALEPARLRDKILTAYERSTCNEPDQEKPDWSYLLADEQAYQNYLQEAFPPEHIDLALEMEAYKLLQNPAAMQEVIVSHLRFMWTEVLEPEWQRVRPTLEACVDAFQEVPLSGKNLIEVVQTILGQEVPEEIPEKWIRYLDQEEVEQIIFVPSAHIGPYLGTLRADQIVWFFFGARLPEGSQVQSPALSRAELLVRLNALADDIRLQIINLLAENDEMCSQDIMHELGVSQSAVSRHLKQLAATGYLRERRQDSAKCYHLNQERIENTLQALENFLLGVSR